METRSPLAAEVLGQLSQSLAHMLELLQVMVSTIRPPSASTLPTVKATLSGIAQATEHAALQVLDEAEALQDDQARLTAALERLRTKLVPADAEAVTVWTEAAACARSLSARALRITAAMEFQDLTAQHIDHTVAAVEDVRGQLAAVLALFDEDAAADAPPCAPAAPHGLPGPLQGFAPDQARQALADRLLAERG